MESKTRTDEAGVEGIRSYTAPDRDYASLHNVTEPIAICGMALRLPGGVDSPERLWELMINKRETRCPIPPDRFNIDGFFNNKQPKPSTVKMTHGHFLDGLDLRHFDASFFSMSRTEVERLDPQQRLLLEVVYECFESAGEVSWRGKQIGCFAGTFGQDWGDLQSMDKMTSGLYKITGQGDFLLSNRISFEYDLKGPSFTVKTACSSSLTALHLACQALNQRECTGAVVSGSNVIIAPDMSIAMTEQNIVSADGRCKTFDASADGYGRGEAINAVYLKRVSDAVRDGNPIRALIRGIGTNCDGKSASLASPSSQAHEDLIRETYARAGLHSDYAATPFVECHGTGTAVGDPLEAAAIARVFGRNGTYIGSVKPNVGHSEGASGITSLIKVILALERKKIPPNINFSTPNPKIPFEEAGLIVPLQEIPWPQDRATRASINSFGLGGANAHAIIESAPSSCYNEHNRDTCPRAHLLVFSANRAESLEAMLHDYNEYLSKGKCSVGDLAYTLALRRENMRHRAFAVTDGSAFDNASLPMRKVQGDANVTLVFSGQGSQWPEMCATLLEDFTVFESSIQTMDAALKRLDQPPPWSIREKLLEPPSISRIHEAEFSQPLCTAIQIGLVNVWRQLGVHPDSVVGHSSGEIAAAYAAGALDAEQAILTAYFRGQVAKTQMKPGAMAALGLNVQEARELLVDGVVIACENSSRSVTISGDKEAVDEVLQRAKMRYPDTLARPLRVNQAYHSHHTKPCRSAYHRLLCSQTSPRDVNIAFFSTVYGERLGSAARLDADYWCLNMESPVRFHSAVRHLLEELGDEDRVFLEVGPHSTLAGPLAQILRDAHVGPKYVSTVKRDQSSTIGVLNAVGELWTCGVPLNFSSLYPSGGRVLVDLPRYSWHHEELFFAESRISKAWRMRKAAPHEILGAAVLEWNDLTPTWRNILKLGDVPWISNHRVGNRVVFPGAGYVAMVGEAVRQLTGEIAYCLRDVAIGNAMVLEDGDSSDGIETMTILRKVRLTDSLDSDWYEFEVSSFDGASWTKHCWGQARSGNPPSLARAEPLSRFARHVDADRWYRAMSNAGIDYAGPFHALEDVSADPTANVAAATISVPAEPTGSRYGLHPCTIDLMFQLLAVAALRGRACLLDSLSVPTFIAEIYVGTTANINSMRVRASVDPMAGGAFTGDAVSFARGETVFQLRGLQASGLDNAQAADTLRHGAVQLDWKPDFNFVDPRQMIRPSRDRSAEFALLEEFFFYCALDVLESLDGVVACEPHLERLHLWLQHYTQGIRESGTPLFSNAADHDALQPKNSAAEAAQKIYRQLLDTDVRPCAVAIERNRSSCRAIFQGETTPLELLMEGGILSEIYDLLGLWDYGDFFKLLGHKKPTLRILEVGAGTGATTAAVLAELQSDFGERLYSSYTYTDISPGFFEAARSRFQQYENVEFSVLDISQDPIQQGFQEGSYDLVIAVNVLHATPSLLETLKNVRKLLSPRGKLLLQELCPRAKWANFLFGTLPGWWLGGADGRLEEPYVSPRRWHQELKAAGFSGTDAVIYDSEPPFHINASMIATASVAEAGGPARVTFLFKHPITGIHLMFAAAFEHEGTAVDWRTLHDPIPEDQDVLSVLELERPFLDEISPSELHLLIKMVSNIGRRGILWLTHASQIGHLDPRYAKILGLARNIRGELSADLCTVELDDVILDEALGRTVVQLYKNFAHRDRTELLDPDFEYVVCQGQPHIGRFHWISVHDALQDTHPSAREFARLQIGRKGLLQTLHFSKSDMAPLQPDEVRIKVSASGINFKDVLIAMAVIRDDNIGLEAAGTIVEVGDSVTDFCIGDRVLTMSNDCHASHVLSKDTLCAKIPEHLSFQQAATMPVVYTTAIRALLDVGRLEKGQTVLIHSAAGGVGIAAIQICKMIGATVFATAGSEGKRRFLAEKFDIPPSSIFDSRSPQFIAGVMHATKGRGVDLVLNSLSGELLHYSWQCVAEFGTLVEIGKRDLIGRGKLALHPFEDNRTYVGIDLSHICANRKLIVKELLERMISFYNAGHIAPILPMEVFDQGQAENAFRYMQKGTHMGKVVLQAPRDITELRPVSKASKIRFRPDVSYLMPGGLGGLGQAVSRWMVENGARHLVFLSRSGKTSTNAGFLSELEAAGSVPQVFVGSVEDEAAVRTAVQHASRPIAGVMQMSMVLKDCATRDMSYDEWQAVMGPRVVGTWNLHRLLENSDLDFFILFSSLGGVVGQWGQANYAASNTFLDSFVHYRHSLGLPASAIEIGPVEDVGFVSQSGSVMNQMRSVGAFTLREEHLLEAVHLAVLRSEPVSIHASSTRALTNPSVFGVGLRSRKRLDDPANRLIWRRDARMAIYRNLEKPESGTRASVQDDLKQFLSTVSADPGVLDEAASIDVVAREIGKMVSRYLMRPEDEILRNKSLSVLGVDSLVSIEIRNWCQQQLGLEIGVLEVMQSNVSQLAKRAIEGLRGKAECSTRANENGDEEAQEKWERVLQVKVP